jgi:DNA-binding NarL/FixJ family response regulator
MLNWESRFFLKAMDISILIADDNAMIRWSLRHLLESQTDFTILGEASDGVEAIQFCQSFQPDVLILDISMPKMNGLDAIPLIHRVSSRTRIIIFSSHAPQGYEQKALSKGAVSYIQKPPIGSGCLVQAIRQVVAR